MDKTKILASVAENRIFIITVIIIFIIVMILYYTSKSYRVTKTLSNMDNLSKYMHINSKLNEEKNKNLKLCDFYIASVFRPYIAKNQYLDYIDLEITKKIIKSGVRCMYVDIFNSNMGSNAEPIISTGFKNGEWKLSLNTILFDDFCKLLAISIFSPAYVNNFNDPFILLLNLNTNNNYNCLNKIKKILYKRFKKYLLDNRYTYSRVNIAEEFISDLEKKIIIITSDGYENTQLEELVNHSWKNETITKINYESLDPAIKVTKSIKFNSGELREYNKNNLTIVTPNENKWSTHNYHPNYFFEAGCQFVCLNYHHFDTHFDKYISKFRRDSFIPKPKSMVGSKKEKQLVKGTNNKVIQDKKLANSNILGSKCPDKPSENYLDTTDLINMKDDNSSVGLCFKGTPNGNSELFTNDGTYSCSVNNFVDSAKLTGLAFYSKTPSEEPVTATATENTGSYFKDADGNNTIYEHTINEGSDFKGNVCLFSKNQPCPNKWLETGNITAKPNIKICCRNI